MKEQVTDISKVLQGMAEEIRLLRETVNQQYAEIIKLNRNINALNLEIRKKDTELINLRERLAKVKALVVYLSVVQFLPYGRIASFLREVFGLTPSEGSLVNWVNEAKRNAQPVIDKIKEYIKSSAVVGFDESGLYCNKRLDWAWIAQTVYYTLLFRADGRGSKVLADKFGDSLERMTAVTDRHSAYFALHFLNHQVCLAHLLRELQYLSELNTEQEWSGKVTNLFREAIHERNTNPNDVIDKVSWTRRLDNLLKQNIEGLGKKFITFRKGLVKCRDYSFNFLENPMIPFDNNGSERGIRKLKIKLKNSCTFRSDFGADAFFELHSIVETAKKHDKTPYNVMRFKPYLRFNKLICTIYRVSLNSYNITTNN